MVISELRLNTGQPRTYGWKPTPFGDVCQFSIQEGIHALRMEGIAKRGPLQKWIAPGLAGRFPEGPIS
jgi:hypothetical protein